ncbi:MAG: sigma-70 family RNA polymerase sigma factor [Bradyrhizobium sp.]|nr:MAG: sigma-70 family RNA polymerase sigma factor [Bradyrhizobium sp.]
MYVSTLNLGLPPPPGVFRAALTALRRTSARRFTSNSTPNLTTVPDNRTASARDDRWVALIHAIGARQDRQAFAELFGHFAPRIKSYLQRTGASEAQAEDVAQETMLSVWRKAALFDAASAGVATWIFTIARNSRIDAFRRERRGGAIRVGDAEAEFEIDPTPGAEARLAAGQADARVREALAELSEDQLRVVRMSFFDEIAHSDIARTLQIPLGTVKSRLRLAMKRLRGILDQDL